MAKKISDAIDTAGRGEQVREFFTTLNTHEDRDVTSIDLGTMRAVHLLALGGTGQAAFDAWVLNAWKLVKPLVRLQMVRKARRELESAEYLSLTEESAKKGQYSVSAQAAIIMAARMHPPFVATFGYENSRRSLRVFGIGDTEEPLRGCLIESKASVSDDTAGVEGAQSPLNWNYRYRLVTRAGAAHFMAGVAMIPPDEPAAVGPRLIRIYRPPVRDRHELAVLEISGGSERVVLVRADRFGNESEPVVVDQEGLGIRIEDLLIDASTSTRK